MQEVILHLDGKDHPVDLHLDSATHPCGAFLLLAHVPVDPAGCVILNYGNSNATGNLLMTLYQRSVHEAPELAWILEQVARGIIGFVDAERAKWPSDDKAGRA